jgi:DNA-binding transcriptional ArsR family regulator/uncharacterized protein YndB with AHSA1/START domain
LPEAGTRRRTPPAPRGHPAAAVDASDAVFKALADPSRRELLDRLNGRNGQTLTELCEGLGIARQSVSKHVEVLERAGLVVAQRQGRRRLHHLNAAPINDIAERWIDRYHRRQAHTLAAVKRALDDRAAGRPDPTDGTIDSSTDDTPEESRVAAQFVYATFIDTTPEELWAALTTPAIMRQYWGVALDSDWQPGSPVHWGDQADPDDTVVLEADPPRRLSYTWHNYQPEHAALFGWSAERLAELRREPPTKVTFDIEPYESTVKLTVTHEALTDDSEMVRAAAGRRPESPGWPLVVANLKTLLETGRVMSPPDTP